MFTTIMAEAPFWKKYISNYTFQNWQTLWSNKCKGLSSSGVQMCMSKRYESSKPQNVPPGGQSCRAFQINCLWVLILIPNFISQPLKYGNLRKVKLMWIITGCTFMLMRIFSWISAQCKFKWFKYCYNILRWY